MKSQFCEITVAGNGMRGYHGSTHRPRLTTTRPLPEFFRGMSAYGRAISDHVLGCKRCTPAKILPFLRNPELPATMQPDRLVKRLIRRDTRTPRAQYFRVLGSLGDAGNVVWAARFGSPSEVWQFLQGLQEHADRVPWNPAREVSLPAGNPDAPWERVFVEMHEALPSRTSSETVAFVKATAILHRNGLRLPASRRELADLIPVIDVQGS